MKFSIETTIHTVMITFALASVSNVTAFFVATDHHVIVALLMALALGTAVAALAIMLTKVDMVKQRNRYIAIGAMVLSLVGVSGFVQMQGYLLHGLSVTVSAAMGFGIVFSGECLTAIALSLYQAAERRRKIDEADSGLELKLAETFAETLDAIDPTNSVKYLQRHIDTIVKYKADQLVSQYIPTVAPVHSEKSPVTPVKKAVKSTPKQSSDLHSELLKILQSFDTPDQLNKSEIARQLNISRPTVNKYISELEEAGRLSMNGVIKVS